MGAEGKAFSHGGREVSRKKRLHLNEPRTLHLLEKIMSAKYSDYEEYLVTTRIAVAEKSSQVIRVNPLPGQGLSVETNVECSTKMRREYPLGTIFKLSCRLTDKEGGTKFLFSHFSWPFEVLTKEEADLFILENHG